MYPFALWRLDKSPFWNYKRLRKNVLFKEATNLYPGKYQATAGIKIAESNLTFKTVIKHLKVLILTEAICYSKIQDFPEATANLINHLQLDYKMCLIFIMVMDRPYLLQKNYLEARIQFRESLKKNSNGVFHFITSLTFRKNRVRRKKGRNFLSSN
jgi:hypothetical protein